jgi:hypothetical protein
MAKLSFLNKNKNTALAHPYYWSGFVINGNADPIQIGKSTHRLWWVILVILMIVTVVLVAKKRKKSI